jgi:hypothetical protein
MRVDHFAYQRATRVASFGLAVQFVIALTLFLFSRLAGDTAFQFASYYAAIGVLLWLALIIVFHQHKLERLEALEEDELAAARSGGSSVFDADDFGIRVAARRLRAMHAWLMPIISVVIAVLLAGVATLMLRWMGSLDNNVEAGNEFARTEYLGWAVSICLAFAAMAFIISRFIAGMAKQTGWQNLRGGAAYMVGNALVMIAVAVGIIFRFFNNDAVIEAIGYAIPIFMLVYAAEIALNLLLNFYRPRVPGEVPRPAFDSKVLSLFAAPDNLVRSINEAINYQFGFDVTSTWGYQLLLRSFGALIIIGIAVLVLLNTMVIVEPHQQAIRLRGGAIIGEAGNQVHDAGLMWKWPWPYETAEIYDVDRIRSLSITARRTRARQLNLWSEDLDGKTDIPLEPFVVKAARESSAADTNAALAAMNAAGLGSELAPDEAGPKVSEQLALVDLEISLEYRIRRANSGLLDYLMFGSDQVGRRQRFNERERIIRIVTEAVVTQHIVSLPLDDVLEQQGGQLAGRLQTKLQERLDDPAVKAGVEVVAINLMLVRPSTGRVAQAFEELPISRQAREQRTAEARQRVASDIATAIGDITRLDVLLKAIDDYEALRNDRTERRVDESQAAFDNRQTEREQAMERLRREIEARILQGGGSAARIIANAQTDRWIRVIDQRARAERVRSELAAYQAAPRLFREMRTMAVYSRVLQRIDKYIVGVDAENIAIDLDFPKLDPLLNFTDSQGEDPEN